VSTIFQNEQARSIIENAYERFRARIGVATESTTVTTRFGSTHVLCAGPRHAPPLVVVHGALASSAHVLGELGPLLERFRVYAPDVIGQSVKSADTRVALDGPDYAHWLSDVLDGLHLQRAHVYGVSWGGFVATRLAQYAPERIDRLVLLVPAGIVSGPAWKGFTRVGLPLALYRAFPSRARLVRFASAVLTTLDDAWVDYLGEAFRSYKLDIRVPPLAKPEQLAHFQRPTLVFGASDDLSFPGAPLLARARQLWPQAETELLEGSRHAPPTDAAFKQRLGEHISAFLESAPRARQVASA
jgi:2-hydroxy-6-oxonona-2,4-dienedioate hydrolase